MNEAAIHLAINHLSIIGILIGVLILVVGLSLKTTHVKLTALGVIIFSSPYENMKKVLLLLLVVSLNIGAAFSQDWQTDFEEAKEIATLENKPIVLVFQGSDWCAPCIKLDHEIWSTDTFISYSKENYVMLRADFPRRKKNALSESQSEANAKLAEIYNKRGIFPFVVILDNEGKILGETGYKKTTPSAYIKELNCYIK